MRTSYEPPKPREVWTLRSNTAALDVEKKTGWIRSCRWLDREVDLFQLPQGGIPGYIGGIRVYDEADRRWYADGDTPFTLSGAAMRGRRLHFRKQFEGAPFVLTISFVMDGDGLSWEVAAVKRNGRVGDRSLRVYFDFPLIAGWNVWAPCRFGEKPFDGMTPFEFMYTQIPYVSDQEIILPMVSSFHRALGVGYSIVEPIDENVPAAKFGFNNMGKCFNWGSMRKQAPDAPVLETVNYYIGLVGDRPMRTRVLILFHGGDWRCGLGLVYRRYREFFEPFNAAIYEREGVFMCGDVRASDQADKLVAMGVKTLEVHAHFEDYCDYFQDGRNRWLSIGAKETLRSVMLADRKKAGVTDGPGDCISRDLEQWLAGHTEQELAAKLGMTDAENLFHTRSDIHARLEKLARAGIACHWYFNYTDGYRPRVEREWPDAISRDEDGAPLPSGWFMCHNMNADPRGSFGKFCIRSARKIFDAYPMLRGFFLDCFRHYEIDFAHDDGVTVVNGKPAYSMNHSYDEVERRIKTGVMKGRNLTSFANKPVSIRSMRYCDGQLLEGDGEMYEAKYFWASIAMPMFYMWGDSLHPLDEHLRRAVLYGCYPKNSALTDENIALYRRYLPLYAQFKRRVLCFEPDPIRGPDDSRAQLYTLADGYIAGVVNVHVGDRDAVKWGRRPYVLFRVARAHDVAKAGVMYPGDTAFRAVAFKFDGTFIAVPLDGYKNCAAVKLFVKGDSGKQIGPDLFQQRARMCGDPDSSFEDLSGR